MDKPLVTAYSSGPQLCHRCAKVVYPTERTGPINEALFHKNCFRCFACGINLNINSYCASPDFKDREVYCSAHKPQLKNAPIDIKSVQMKTQVSAQSFYAQSNAKDHNLHTKNYVDNRSVNIQHVTNMTKQRNDSITGAQDVKGHSMPSQAPRIDSHALNIRGAKRAQKLLKDKKSTYSKHHFFPYFNHLLEMKKEEIFLAQEDLEKKHRSEEEILLQTFQKERQIKEEKLKADLEAEWEVHLKELTAKKMAHNEKEKLQKTIRMKQAEDRKTVLEHLQAEQQEKTAELVSKQSKEMLQMLAKKHQEIEIELETMEDSKLGQESDKKDRNGVPLTQMFDDSSHSETSSRPEDEAELEDLTETSSGEVSELQKDMSLLSFIPDRVPSPCPPSRPKKSLYIDADIFQKLDEHVISIAQNEQLSFTELTRELIAPCMSELEKVRAIFRWITVKDLSSITTDDIEKDSPIGFLRGIQFGNETYHVLFMRLCSYAGIHAVEVKGYSKSVGYEPGLPFANSNKFKNTWNAAFVDGDWRLIQCNWAARHLVFNRDIASGATVPAEKTDKLRYQYDEHYFLTDPEDFIYEFFPSDPKWQLLKDPISLSDFERLPFVRSALFHFGLKIPKSTPAVLQANEVGGASLEIILEKPDVPVVCHYQFRCAATGKSYYQGHKLDRFVFFTVPVPGRLVFDIHAPEIKPYFLEIFAALVEPNNPATYGYQVKLKCVAKFKLETSKLEKRMNPLPHSNSATGEWGPSKAVRHFLITPVNHLNPIIKHDAAAHGEEVVVAFNVPDKIIQEAQSFSVFVHKNGLTPQILSRFVRVKMQENKLVIAFKPPESGNYSLEIFLEREQHQPTHVCKYLLRVNNVNKNEETLLGSLMVDENKVKSGPYAPSMKKYGLTYNSEHKPKFFTTQSASIHIEFSFSDILDFGLKLVRLFDGSPVIEDHSDNCEVRAYDKKVTFLPQFVSEGRYHFHIYAKKTSEQKFERVFTFKIVQTVHASDSSQ